MNRSQLNSIIRSTNASSVIISRDHLADLRSDEPQLIDRADGFCGSIDGVNIFVNGSYASDKYTTE